MASPASDTSSDFDSSCEDSEPDGNPSSGRRLDFPRRVLAFAAFHAGMSAACGYLAAKLLRKFGVTWSNWSFFFGALSSWLGALAVLLAGSCALLLTRRLPTSSLHADVERYVVLSWLMLLAKTWYCLARMASSSDVFGEQPYTWATIALAIFNCTGALSIFFYTLCIERRLELLERAFRDELGSRRVRVLRCAQAAISVLIVVVQLIARCTASSFSEFREPLALEGLMDLYVAAVFVALGVIIARAFTGLLSVTSHSVADVGIYVRSEAAWSHRVLRSLRLSMMIPCVLSGALYLVVFGLGMVFSNVLNDLFESMSVAFLTVTDLSCLFRVVGFRHEQRPELRIQKEDGNGHRKMDLLVGSHAAAWEAKVRDLAERSVRVGDLLEFHARLGGGGAPMPHYDAWRSTTNDVVRQAIIPLSRSGDKGTAYSCLLSREATPAHCMVTHAWSSLFLDLVAAVAADALGSADYSGVAESLAAGQHGEVASELKARGALDRAYWICAFCINQHASICGGFPHEPPKGTAAHATWDACRRDTVTGQVFPLCHCHQPKRFNDSADETELNKFDHVMAHLQERVPGFQHVAAVDRHFAVFSRVWCVAELVQGHFSRIPQRVQLCSSEGLQDDAEDLNLYRRLATLTVAEAEATRPEDREAILSTIPSIPEFDAKLQVVIFGEHGLLSRSFVGFDIFEAAAHTARRLRALSMEHSASDDERG